MADDPSTAAPTSIAQAAASGDRRQLLVATRDLIAGQLDEGVPPRDLASLTLRLLAVTAEIAEIDAAKEGDAVGNAAGTADEAWTPPEPPDPDWATKGA